MKKPQQKETSNSKIKQILKSMDIRKVIIIGIAVIAISVFIFGKTQHSESIANVDRNEVILTDATFNETVLKSDKIVMVDFWATWCGPCKMMAPIVKEIAKDYEGKVLVAKLDVDQNKAATAKYNISSIPTILFFKNGKIVDQQIGMCQIELLKLKIDNLMK